MSEKKRPFSGGILSPERAAKIVEQEDISRAHEKCKPLFKLLENLVIAGREGALGKIVGDISRLIFAVHERRKKRVSGADAKMEAEVMVEVLNQRVNEFLNAGINPGDEKILQQILNYTETILRPYIRNIRTKDY